MVYTNGYGEEVDVIGQREYRGFLRTPRERAVTCSSMFWTANPHYPIPFLRDLFYDHLLVEGKMIPKEGWHTDNELVTLALLAAEESQGEKFDFGDAYTHYHKIKGSRKTIEDYFPRWVITCDGGRHTGEVGESLLLSPECLFHTPPPFRVLGGPSKSWFERELGEVLSEPEEYTSLLVKRLAHPSYSEGFPMVVLEMFGEERVTQVA